MTEQSTTITVAQPATLGFLQSAIETFEGVQKLAEVMSKMGTMPAHLTGKPADCFRIVVQAAKWRMDPFAVAECTSLVHGRLCYEGKLVAAVLIAMGAIEGRLTYDIKGEGQAASITVTGTPRGGTVRSISGTVKDWRTVTKKDNNVIANAWDKDPASMLVYRGTRQWARLYAPEAILGVYTPDELEDIRTVDAVVVGTSPSVPQPARTANAADPAMSTEPAKSVEDKKEPEQKSSTTKATPAPILRGRALWTDLEKVEKGLGSKVIDRLSALHGAKAPKDIAEGRLAAFEKDVDELFKDLTKARVEDLLSTWEHAAKEGAA